MTSLKMFHTYLIQQIAESSSERVLNAILNSLIISRLPYNVRQIIIRGRRTFEEQQGNQLSTDDLLEMLNNAIHDLELTQGNTAKPAKMKEEAGKVDQQSHKKRSFVTKRGRDDKKKFCALCNANAHRTITQSDFRRKMLGRKGVKCEMLNFNTFTGRRAKGEISK